MKNQKIKITIFIVFIYLLFILFILFPAFFYNLCPMFTGGLSGRLSSDDIIVFCNYEECREGIIHKESHSFWHFKSHHVVKDIPEKLLDKFSSTLNYLLGEKPLGTYQLSNSISYEHDLDLLMREKEKQNKGENSGLVYNGSQWFCNQRHDPFSDCSRFFGTLEKFENFGTSEDAYNKYKNELKKQSFKEFIYFWKLIPILIVSILTFIIFIFLIRIKKI